MLARFECAVIFVLILDATNNCCNFSKKSFFCENVCLWDLIFNFFHDIAQI